MTTEEKLKMKEVVISFINNNPEFWANDMKNHVITETGFTKSYISSDYKTLLCLLVKQQVIKVLTHRKTKNIPERMYYREHCIYIIK